MSDQQRRRLRHGLSVKPGRHRTDVRRERCRALPAHLLTEGSVLDPGSDFRLFHDPFFLTRIVFRLYSSPDPLKK